MPSRARKSPPLPQANKSEASVVRRASPSAWRPREATALALILLATFLAYWPALSGMLLWDDDAHVTPPGLQSLHGLGRIWFNLGATQQYYPLLYTWFWLEHALWGDSATPYHVLNVFLHAICAWLVALLARRLGIAGAWLAGAVFALHPACVEAVAWISEQKSTLSGVFFLLAALLYLEFDRTRSRGRYLGAFALFLSALATKSVTATLPAALLVVLWWKRGRLDARRDLVPLIPWLTIGAISGLFTAWVERHYVHAEGADFTLTALDRLLLAGRVPWHYLLHILWPVNLSFFYPRFAVNTSDPIQILFPVATLAVLIGLAFLARTRRGPLAAALIFVGTLTPVLGFLNVYPFRYSWIADHFAYLASIAVIVPLCALIVGRLQRYTAGASVALLATLGLLTWRQAQGYTGAEALWRATIERAPSAWMPHYNLGLVLETASENDPARRTEAISEFRAAVRYKSDDAPSHAELAGMLEQNPENRDEALREYQTALRLDPSSASVHGNYGLALMHAGRLQDAITEFETAIRIDPRLISAHNNLALALSRDPSRAAEAEAQARAAISLDPSFAMSHNLLGMLLMNSPGRATEGIAELESAVRLDSGYQEAHYNLAKALAEQPGRVSDAIAEYEAALRIDPSLLPAHYNLALLLAPLPGRIPDAIAHLEAAQRLDPTVPQVNEMLAHLRSAQALR